MTVEKRDPYTSGHQLRVAILAKAIAEELDLPQTQVESIYMAASIHDIGKISLPAEILVKPIPLTNIEISLIQAHAQAGYDILSGIDFPWPIADIVVQHHERMDGSGYPQGLAGKDILLEARIICVADVVETMASHRPYRPSIGMDKALEEITDNRGVLYDPDVVDACLRLFRDKNFQFPVQGESKTALAL
jgi:putative nucleotidyltransferase with HDIG domain